MGKPLLMTERRTTVIALSLAALALFGACGDDAGGGGDEAAADPELVADGKEYYEGTCAACHGIDLEGTQTGPPFLDPVYAPNHHPDAAFYTAVEFGVQPHHWKFGAMPPQKHITEEQVAAIVAYVRSVQAEEGITHDPGH